MPRSSQPASKIATTGCVFCSSTTVSACEKSSVKAFVYSQVASAEPPQATNSSAVHCARFSAVNVRRSRHKTGSSSRLRARCSPKTTQAGDQPALRAFGRRSKSLPQSIAASAIKNGDRNGDKIGEEVRGGITHL